ncbi:DUF4236 domain-containing protein [Xanthomonas citri]|uniref:DUF4236 domain-containing protein n=1 Tax=Xanthomonas citri TaxID=346 RepID=UPI0005286C8F
MDDMGLQFRQSFEVFPGVRLNLSGSGITASFGVDGATVNVGAQGIRSTIGIPGSGLSFTTNHCPPSGSPTPRASVPPQGYAPTYAPVQPMREINSASVERLTSHSLVELRDLIAKARSQRKKVDQDLAQAQATHHAESADLERRQRSWFRWFMKRRIAELEASVQEAAGEVQRLVEWQSLTHIDMCFEASDAAQRAYGALVRAFEALRQSKAIWDITSDRDTDRVRERSAASRTLDRKPVQIHFSSSELVRFAGHAMRFGNINGEDILIYPGVVIMPRADGAFALIELREVDLQYHVVGFLEHEVVPPDAVVVGQTWEKVNKDGSRDMRFRDNDQIPIVQYGRLLFTSPGGVQEEYQFSNAIAAGEFARAFDTYKVALSAQ